jgi:hypothetical protein
MIWIGTNRQRRTKQMPPSKQRKQLRVLSRLNVAEISAVDRGAGENCNIVLTKRHDRAALKKEFDKAAVRLALSVKSIIADDTVTDKKEMLSRTFGQALDHLSKLAGVRTSLDAIVKLHQIFGKMPDEDDDDETRTEELSRDADERSGESTEHFHAGGSDDDETTEATDGIESAESAMEKNMQTHSEMLSAVAKKYGVHALAKSVAAGNVSVSEHELTQLISEQAKREGTSFVKLFEAQDEAGATLRKAIAAARDQQFLSRTTTMSKAEGVPGRATLTPRSSGFSGGGRAQNVDAPKTALAALQELVDAQRAANPALSESEAWLRVYEHPGNIELALRERAENRPGATAW